MLNVKRNADTERNVWQGENIAFNGLGLGEEWEFEKLQFGAKHYVSPFFAKPML